MPSLSLQIPAAPGWPLAGRAQETLDAAGQLPPDAQLSGGLSLPFLLLFFPPTEISHPLPLPHASTQDPPTPAPKALTLERLAPPTTSAQGS